MPSLNRNVSLSQQVADQLRRRIAGGEFPVGSLLPTEMELTQELGVSRNSVREGLRALVHAGLLDARPGYGTIVIAVSDLAPTLARRLQQDRATDVAEVRLLLEREGARLAASRATERQIEALTAALAARAAATDGPGYAAADIAFHRLLLDASGNALLAELYRGTGGNEQALFHLNSPDLDFAAASAELRAADAEHAAIVEAIVARDPDAAAAAAERTVQLVQAQAQGRVRTQAQAGNGLRDLANVGVRDHDDH